MPLVLKAGETWEDPYGNVSGDFYARVKTYNVDDIDERIDVNINIYKDETAFLADKAVVKSVPYSVDDATYATVMLAHKDVIRNQNKEIIPALEILVLQKPAWGDWEQM